MADLDGDGVNDLISGSWPGPLSMFKGSKDGTFAAAVPIKDSEGAEIKPGSASVVFAFDWDNNGTLDLILGNIEGAVQISKNDGTAKEPKFGKPEALKADGQPIKVAGDSGPTVADWDGDGLPDLIVGAGDGAVTWFRNTGKKGAPSLEKGQVLIAAAKWDGPSEACGLRTKVHAVDFTEDGKLDLLVGDFRSEMGKAPELTAEEKEAAEKFQKEFAAIQKEYSEALQKTEMPKLRQEMVKLLRPGEKETPEEAKAREAKRADLQKQIDAEMVKVRPLLDKLIEAQKKIPRAMPKYHGRVWLFERKSEAKAARAEKAAAADEKKDEPKEKKGSVVGVVAAKGDNWIEVKADGEEKARRYVPHWRGGLPKDGGGPDKEIIKLIKDTPLNARIKLDWEFEERARVVKIEVLKAPKSEK